ncbi:MAG: hypothetical protein ABIR58_06570 [Gemmatimonadaceae bacterium]
MIRLTRSPFLRAFAALAIAIASAGIEVSHGLIHDDDHHRESSQVAAHSAGSAVTADERGEDHPHERVSEALRIRGDASDLVALGGPDVVAELPAATSQPSLPVADERLIGDRATGPPPRLRAPPLD